MTLYSQMNGQNQPIQQTQPQTPQINPQAVASVKRMMQTLQGSSNPAQVMRMLASQNPQIAGIMQMANGAGSFKNLFYQRAQQLGKDPSDIISHLK